MNQKTKKLKFASVAILFLTVILLINGDYFSLTDDAMTLVEFVDILAEGEDINHEREYQNFYKSASEGVLKLPQSYILYAMEENMDDESSHALIIRWSILICIGLIILEAILHLLNMSLNYLSFFSTICIGVISIAITGKCHVYFKACWILAFFFTGLATHLWNMKNSSENENTLANK